MQTYKQEFAEFLVQANALQFGEFTLKSGRKSPYFFNSSKFNTGLLIEQLGRYYALAIKDHLPECNLIFGPAYKGIPLCVAASTALSRELNQNIGYFFNRKEKKTHGDQGTLVGQSPVTQDKVVMVDDVITDGLTKIESVEMIRELCQVEFSGVVVSLDRMEKNTQGQDAIGDFMQKTGVQVWSIINIREVLECLYDKKIAGQVVINASIKQNIEDYLAEYCVR